MASSTFQGIQRYSLVLQLVSHVVLLDTFCGLLNVVAVSVVLVRSLIFTFSAFVFGLLLLGFLFVLFLSVWCVSISPVLC